LLKLLLVSFNVYFITFLFYFIFFYFVFFFGSVTVTWVSYTAEDLSINSI